MARYCNTILSVTLSLSIFFLLLSRNPASASRNFNLSSKLSSDVIDKICAKTLNPTFCVKTLNSNPNATTATTPELCQDTIDTTRTAAQITYKAIEYLVAKTTDPRTKMSYQTCSELYDSAISDLDECTKFLKSGDIDSLNTYVSAVITDGDTCTDTLSENDVAVLGEINIIDENKKMQDLGGIILSISSFLEAN